MSRVELTVPVDVNAPVEAVWQTVTDWPRAGGVDARHARRGRRAAATAATSARGCAPSPASGPLGFTDTMEIVEWEPPRRCVVRHTGKVVRGDGRVRGGAARRGPGPVPVVGAARPAPGRRRGAGLADRRARVPAGDRALAARDGPPVRGGAPWVSSSRGAAGPPRRPSTSPTTTTSGAARCTASTALFERLSLEGFQSGLSWLIILRKRPAFRAAFAGLRSGGRRPVRRGRRRAAARRRRHRPQPVEDRGDGGERPRGAGARHPARRAALVVRPRRARRARPRWRTCPPSARSPPRWRRS